MLKSLNTYSLPDAQRTATDLSFQRSVSSDGCSQLSSRRWSHTQPDNTLAYKVKSTDNLTSIAACYDTTPSVLRKLNRLTADFLYTEQTLYIPVSKDEGSSSYSSSELTSSASDVQTDSDLYSASSYEDELCTSGSVESSHAKTYQQEGIVSPVTPDLSADIRNTPQSFIKLSSSKYIIPNEHNGVTGTLIVTPNAVMFDPYVCDPLVLRNGVEEYGVIAKMDTIISAAIYRDCPAVQDLQRQKSDPTTQKPQIYHAKDCKLVKDGQVECSARLADELDSSEPCSCTDKVSKSDEATEEQNETTESQSETTEEESETTLVQSETALEQSETTEEQSETSSNTDCSNKLSYDLQDVIDSTTSTPIDCAAKFNSTGCGTDDLNFSQSVESRLSWSLASRLLHRRTPSSASSLGSVGITSNTELFVDYNSGMFEMVDVPQANEATDAGTRATDAGAEIMVGNMLLKAGMSKEDKPHLFQPISTLMPAAQTSLESSSQPFYLCLQIGERVTTCNLPDTCPIEAYKKQRQPEYWFTVPSDKVDSLYNFFICWRPELYGEEITDVAILSSRGFISIPEKGARSGDASNLPCSPMVRQLSHTKVIKDWEIFSLNEVVRIRSLLDVQKYLPFPEMEQGSLLLSEQDIRELVTCLPARVEGHQWRLSYSNEDHGFSLSTLYRNMSELDSATILVVQDENNGLFGAFSSTSIHMCEHFYGNGECFLFSYVDGFKQYNWTSKNLFCIQGDSQGITIGTGSATCGLWMDSGLYHGRTQHCDTFDNEPLTGGDEDFIIKAIEVWTLSDGLC